MSKQPDRAANLAEQALGRTTVPAVGVLAPSEEGQEPDDGRAHTVAWQEAVRIAVVAIAAACVWRRLWEPFPAISIIGVAGLGLGGWPIFKEALQNLLAKRMTMELSMSIAIIAAAAILEFFTASSSHYSSWSLRFSRK